MPYGHHILHISNTYLIIFSYSLSFPLESFHFLNITEASTFAGENVFGSFNKDIILNKTVLKQNNNKIMSLKHNIIRFTVKLNRKALKQYHNEHNYSPKRIQRLLLLMILCLKTNDSLYYIFHNHRNQKIFLTGHY